VKLRRMACEFSKNPERFFCRTEAAADSRRIDETCKHVRCKPPERFRSRGCSCVDGRRLGRNAEEYGFVRGENEERGCVPRSPA